MINILALKNHLEEFEKKHSLKIYFDSIGKDLYIRFTDYKKAKTYKTNNIGSNIKRIKRLINEANQDNLTTNRDHEKRDFKAIKEDTDSIFLNESESEHYMKLRSSSLDIGESVTFLC